MGGFPSLHSSAPLSQSPQCPCCPFYSFLLPTALCPPAPPLATVSPYSAQLTQDRGGAYGDWRAELSWLLRDQRRILYLQGLWGHKVKDLWLSHAPGPHLPSSSLSPSPFLVHPYLDQTSAIRMKKAGVSTHVCAESPPPQLSSLSLSL